ncbi:hypothetical protein SAMN03159496_05974 [Rhizobium sp. NFR07]|uniref:hypothetical protein n=1 Tax=Rhizobium sp. NFR07 TaxID=1566262 RepID=UPI0008EF388F|nr:hypothetical protein [Rhizobium sp. NFR07]SFB62238.1 hypothetical protein SAMN03159496_05974 [Rhizobium sp. NFR07]
MNSHQPHSEGSELAGHYTENGITVIVEIFRPSGANDWRMEVTSLEDQLTDWNEPFASAHEAWEEFIYVVNTEGIAVSFSVSRSYRGTEIGDRQRQTANDLR